MESFHGDGKTLDLLAPYQRNSGQAAMIGSIFGVACDTVANGVSGRWLTEGEFYLAKTAAQAWAIGDKIYWNAGTTALSNVATDGPLVGVATVVAANPSSFGYVKLAGVAELAEGMQAAVVALTDSTGDSATHDDTLADGLTVTAPDAVTATTPGTGADATTWTGAQCTAAFNDITMLRARVAALATDMAVQNQNDSDLAQKILEIRTVLVNAGLITP